MIYENLDVLILTYNRAHFLEIALKSLFSSTANWRKTVIVNNASTDNTLQVIQNIQKQYPERYIEIITHPSNIGNANNFRYSQKIASNEYTAVFHDDDAVHPEYIERAMTVLMENSNIAMISGGLAAQYNVDEHNWGMLPSTYSHYPSNNNVFYQLICARPTFCINIYRTNIYKKTEYHPEKYGKLHDIVFMMDIGKKGDIALLHGECVRWRQHVNSDSNSLSSGPFTDEILNILSYVHTEFAAYTQKLGMFKRILHRMLTQTLLFNFSYFLYKWAALSRFLTWDEFKKEMIKQNLFIQKEYNVFDKYIDKIFNPMVKKKAMKYWMASAENYDFRLNGQ